jgi:DivIVA domain-containing protein
VLTSQDIAKAQFMTVRLKEGYDMGEVDDFLDRLVATMEKYEQGVAERSGAISATDVREQGFTTVRIREGYDMADVDELLDQAAETLQTLESRPARPQAQPHQPPAGLPPQQPPPASPVPPVHQPPAGSPVHQPPAGSPVHQPPPGSPAGSAGGLSTFELVQQLLSLYAGAGPSVWAVGPDGRRYGIEGVKATTTGLTITLSD